MIDSTSIGDPGTFQSLDRLGAAFRSLRPAPRDAGRVVAMVSRGVGGRRELLERVHLTPESGFPGDAWGRKPQPNPDAQVSVMQAGVARLIANGQPLALFGDNLFLDLDLSTSNFPAGSRLRAGGVTLEVTPMPHNGCRKFHARFGEGAILFTSKPELRPLNLRGIYMRVVEGGEVAVGDPVVVIRRVTPRSLEPE